MVRDRLLTVIPRLSTEWIVSFTVRMTSLVRSNYFCNVLHLTKGGTNGQHGDRTPSVYLTPLRDKYYFATTMNQQFSFNTETTKGLVINVLTHIEIHQRYTSGGEYRFFIKINGEEVYSTINTNAQQFYNVKVYGSNPWEKSCTGYIKNFEVTNFL